MKQLLQSSLWSYRDVRLVLPARAVSFAGDAIALVALTLRVSADGGPAAVTALLLAFALPTVLMIPVAGRIVDGYDSRKVLVAASLLQVVAGVGTAFSSGLAETLGFVCLLQVGQAVAGPAWVALIPRIVGEQLVGRATGASQALTGVAMLGGSAVGGALVAWQGDRVALLVDAATFLLLAVVARLVRTRRTPQPGVAHDGGGAMAGLRAIFADRLLRGIVVGLWVFIVAAEAVNVVEVFLITDVLGLGSATYGAVGAIQGAGMVVGAWYSGRLAGDLGRSAAIVAGTVLVGAGCIAMGLAPGLVVVAAGALALGLAVGLLNASTGALIVTRSPEVLRGRVLAALNGTTRTCSLVALLLGGVAGTFLGARLTFVTAGVACLLTGVLLGLLVAQARPERTGVRKTDSVGSGVGN